MNVDLVDGVRVRLAQSSARSRLDDQVAALQSMMHRSYNPQAYGIEPDQGQVLTPMSIAHARSAIAAIGRAQAGIDRSVAVLAAEIDSQRTTSRAQEGIDLAWGAVGVFLPNPRLVRRYEFSNGRVAHGALVRNERDPRRGMASRVVLSYRGPFTSNTPLSRFMTRYTASPLGFVKRHGEAFVDMVQARAMGWVDNFANPRVGQGLRFLARGLGPVGTVIGGVFAFTDGQAVQRQRDEGMGFSPAEADRRANTRGAINAAATAAGAAGGAVIGAAVGGPVGAVIGGMVGGWLGGLAGDAISDAVLG
jgi:hypothetical protein